MVNPGFHISLVRSATDLRTIAELFEAYAASLGIDLAYQDFASELASLPGNYAPPSGELLLVKDRNGKPLGCVGLRPMASPGHCEMKRLYVLPEGRGLGIGRALVDSIMQVAVQKEYTHICLDSLPTMIEAIALYKKAGFLPIEAYYDTPITGTVFLGRPLP